MSPQIVTLIIYLVVILLVVLSLLMRQGKNLQLKTSVVSITIGLLLTYLTLFEFNQRPVFLNDEADAVELLNAFSINTVDPEKTMEKQEILLIDVSGHTQLLDAPQPLFNDVTKIAITDRKKLSGFLEWLGNPAQINDVDNVVCDIFLEDSTADDAPLIGAIAKLSKANKLLFAKHTGMGVGLEKDRFGVSNVSYSVDITNYENKYFSHNLLDADGRPTLPYELYLRHCRDPKDSLFSTNYHPGRVFRERTSPDKPGYLVNNWLIPEMLLVEDDRGGRITAETGTVFGEILDAIVDFVSGNAMHENAIAASTLLPVGLGAVSAANGDTAARAFLKQAMTDAKNKKKRVTILIGSFSDDRDVHETIFGEMHGGLILLNTYLNLIDGRHKVDWFYGCCLWASLSYAVFFGIMSLFRKEDQESGRSAGRRKGSGVWHFIKHAFEEFVTGRTTYLFLLLVFIVTAVFFHRLVNIMAIGFLFAATDFVIRGLRKVIDSESKGEAKGVIMTIILHVYRITIKRV